MIELSREQYRPFRRTERRVWFVCFVFTALFGGLLMWSMYGCKPSVVNEKKNPLTVLATNSELIVKAWDFSKHTLVFTVDGQIEIDGKAIEKMSDPEIKIAIKEIANALKKQAENDELVEYYDKQTDYLLEELEKCRGTKP